MEPVSTKMNSVIKWTKMELVLSACRAITTHKNCLSVSKSHQVASTMPKTNALPVRLHSLTNLADVLSKDVSTSKKMVATNANIPFP